MIIVSIVIILLLYATSTNQNPLAVKHDFDRTLIDNLHLDTITTEGKTNHEHKRSNEEFHEFAAYNKFSKPSENFALYDELWKSNPQKNKEPQSYLYNCGDYDKTDISCYNDLENDGLKDADGDEMTFPEKNIFFIEASCQMGLTFHQVCSIESAAKANPGWQVSVLFAGRIPKQCQSTVNFTTLDTYGNIHLYRIHVKKFADGTPFQDFFNSNALDNSLHPVYHSAEILKYLTLYKWGGVYLDTNMMVSKPFDNLPLNWIARENDDDLGTAAMALTKDNIGGLISKAVVEYV
ncbi:uncharacterized protein LOC113233844 [Hyposmocoma kahamanoa]|uniref:uncharacterized protein LOC113233844 n=1 Tax=Hyposmocoma kahamanoa TaxID=1477025 RepID=UPI000E6D660A|nr:uncharacterized protein LOC113233844 [Hyposmocoma kahamanoa]